MTEWAFSLRGKPIFFIMRKAFLSIFVLLSCLSGRAAGEPSFRHITSREGLSYTWVKDIFEDSEGYMWFSTIYGACRYDGRHFEDISFPDTGNGNLHSVNAVQEVPQGTLWFATTGGLFRHCPETAETDEPFALDRDITALCADSDGALWVGSRSGGCHIIRGEAMDSVSFSQAGGKITPTAILVDSRKGVWAGTSSGKLFFFDHQAGVFLPTPFESPKSIYDIIEDGVHNLWISTSGAGVFRYSPQSGAVDAFNVASGTLPDDLARQMARDTEGNVWITTEKGLVRISPDGGATTIRSDSSSPHSLNDNAAYAAYFDPVQENLWIGTFFGGVNVCSSFQGPFESYLSSPEEYSADSKVVSVIVPEEDELLVGTENDGVFILSSGDGMPKDHLRAPRIAGDNIHSICRDRDGSLWIGTYTCGISYRPAGSSTFRTFNTANSALTTNNIYIIRSDSRGNLWVGTQYGGLYRYDFTRGSLERFPREFPSHLFIWDIHESRDGDIYLASFGNGLWKLSVGDGYKPEHISMPVSYCVSISELEDGRLLLGTEKQGMAVYSPLTGETICIRRENSLPDDTIYATLQDGRGNVWMSSNSGIIRSDSALDTFTLFTMNDGLPANRFNYNAAYAAPSGDALYFGSTNGVVRITPGVSYGENSDPVIRFGSLYVDGEKVPVGSDILPRRLSSDRRLVLGPEDNSFAIDFSDRLYGSRDNIKYAYRMQGLSSQWNEIGRRHKVDFQSLRPGNYCLSIAPSDRHEQAVSLQIRVRPRWWQSVPAVVGYFLVLLLIAAVVMYSWLSASRHRHDLEMEKLAREKDNELNETKFRFFVNISHEFKTPLSLILGPAEQLIDGRAKPSQTKRYLQIIKHNADKLLSLINELLAFREVQFTKLKISEVSAREILQNCLSRYDWLFEGKKITATMSCPDDLTLEADPGRLEKIIGNLVSNAYKHTPEGGHVALSARERGADEVVFVVEDDGEGIPEEKLPHIFERFFSSESYDKYSSGVGLSYVQSLVELHSGRITVSSEPGRGSRFEFVLPRRQPEHEAQVQADYQSVSPVTPPVVSGEDIDEKEYGKIAAESTLMIVEDDATMRSLLVDYFEPRYNVVAVQSCEEALKAGRDRRVDIVISDVMLGSGMSGFEFCKYLKNDVETSHVKVILTTVLSEESYRTSGYKAGADDYIVKPFSYQLLEQRVKNLLIGSYRLREAYKLNIDLSNMNIDTAGTDEQLIKKVIDHIFTHISDSTLGVETLCGVVGMSKTTLYRKMKSLTGQSTNELIQNVRLKYAARLLSESDKTVSEIAYESGFSDPYYFSRAFKKQYGYSPKLWREKEQSKEKD